MDNAERQDARASKLQQRPHHRSKSTRIVLGVHVSLSIHASGWIFEYVTVTMGREMQIPLRIRPTVAARLRNEAGKGWPVEEV